MRTILIVALLAAGLLIPAQAQERPLPSHQLEDFIGQYTLSDGRVLDVRQRSRRLVAQVEGQDAVVLAPAGPARFMAPDGRLQVAFEQHRNGNVTGVTVDVPAVRTSQASR